MSIGFSKRIGHESHRICYQRKIKMCKTITKNPTIQINEVCYLSGFEGNTSVYLKA
jgi:hypothetical protein